MTPSLPERKKSRGVSKAQWLQMALAIFEEEGIGAVKIERLSARLHVAKSGFYWHFKNREDLRNQLLAFWNEEFTGVVTENPELETLPPRERLRRIVRMIDEMGLNRYEIPMRAWAERDPKARKVVEGVYKRRLAYIGSIFREIGFRGDDLAMRTRLFVVYFSSDRSLFGSSAPRKKSRLRKLCLNLLTNGAREGDSP